MGWELLGELTWNILFGHRGSSVSKHKYGDTKEERSDEGEEPEHQRTGSAYIGGLWLNVFLSLCFWATSLTS